MSLKILMLGWEHPPIHSGGLGVATHNLAKGLSQNGVEVLFVLPDFVHKQVLEHGFNAADYRLLSHKLPTKLQQILIKSSLHSPYSSPKSYQNVWQKFSDKQSSALYGQDLFSEIERYGHEVAKLADQHQFDLLHAHDWMTFKPAIAAQKRQQKPLIAHIHATEFDRTGGNPQQQIYEIERAGFTAADRVIAVSNYTKNLLKKHYGIADDKITVVHNGVEDDVPSEFKWQPRKDRKTVLFLGRLTLQKGPDWLLKVAKKVIEQRDDVDFLIAGSGEMLPELLQETINAKLTDNVHFLGFVNAKQREQAFAQSDLYIMPSVSEPFGLSAVEAAQRGVPVLLSKQSGAREVLKNALCCDFWDIKKTAHYILSLLELRGLQQTLSQHGRHDLRHLSWQKQAGEVKKHYQELIA